MSARLDVTLSAFEAIVADWADEDSAGFTADRIREAVTALVASGHTREALADVAAAEAAPFGYAGEARELVMGVP